MLYLWLLAFAGLQLLLLLAWLQQTTAALYPVMWWASLGGIAACGVFIGWLIPKAYRSLLWRRRKSVRPSREVMLERRRIAAALHDGLGSQLVSAIAVAQSHNDPLMRATLDQCLLDLRVVVDSMDAGDDALPMRLARFRHRIQPVLERRNMSLHWDIWDPEMLGEEGILPRGPMAREVLAIMQEAISNTLQHAAASELWITLTAADRSPEAHGFTHARLCIEDDGQGFRASEADATLLPGGGMGLLNMRRRAAAIGCQLDISSREGGGTVVTLSW